MVFHSTNELKQYIISHSGVALQKATEQIYQVIDRFVKEFYAEYSPAMYERTYQLYRSLVKTDIKSTGNGWTAYVYFDFSSLNYITDSQPSGAQVMNVASWGGHGAKGLHIVAGDTGIWDEPMQILKGQGQAIEILKKMLIAEGISIK